MEKHLSLLKNRDLQKIRKISLTSHFFSYLSTKNVLYKQNCNHLVPKHSLSDRLLFQIPLKLVKQNNRLKIAKIRLKSSKWLKKLKSSLKQK